MKWRKPQRRYLQILREVRTLLNGGNEKPLGLCAGGKFREACGLIRALRLTSPEHFDRQAIRTTRDDARAIAALIDRLEEALRSETLAPELRLRLGLDQRSDNAPAAQLLKALPEVRALCQAGEKNQPSFDQVRVWCARMSFSLMQRFADEQPTSGSARSTYRLISSLLYEVLTGERDRDLKRACDDHLRAMRSLTGG